ncbi:DUF1007 family protein [uncultured Rhodoblastus sp.]|uniref:DUF1007 family protein n=1 Tax=uncultured Rhodoblastus sp. TaxID=543037 RepID=UPI003144E393
MNLFKAFVAAGLAAIGLCPLSANAHPHVWVAARAQILFAPDGKIAAIRHSWTFDEMYSAFAAQGLGKDGKPPTKEELAPLAKTNVESLAEFQYFTLAKTGPKAYEFGEPRDYELEADDKKLVTLRFTLPLKEPVSAKKPFTFMVYDPSYFVDIELEKADPVTLKDAPSGCSLTVLRPDPLVGGDKAKLDESFFTGLAPGANFGVKLATRTIVACP